MDIGLLRKSVEWAKAEAERPEEECEWYQGRWRVSGYMIDRTCGTAYCIAGHIVQETDGPAAWDDGDDSFKIARRAAELLGVDVNDVLGTHGEDALFCGVNTIKDVERHAELLAIKYGEEL